MCTNQKYINIDKGNGNHKRILVKCGHCPACLQEKADYRTNRIHNHHRPGYIWLFVTLTYADECVPYIYKDDLKWLRFEHKGDVCSEEYQVPVYRNSVDFSSKRWKTNPDACRKVYRKWLRGACNYRYVGYAKRTYKRSLLSKPRFVKNWYFQHQDFDEFKSLKGSSDSRRIGVIYYPDLQNFLKRLRINLIRDYDFSENIIYFGCAEYGPTSCRPHFHLLIECPDKNYTAFKSSIIKSWTFDNNRISQYVEIARDAASYVSSYVNCSSVVPSLLQNSDFKPKHSFSPSLGLCPSEFSLPSIIEKIRNGNLTFNRTIIREGKPTSVVSVIPQYVLRRYFPVFKGFNRLTTDERIYLLEKPSRIFTDTQISFKLGTFYRPNAYDNSHLSDENKIFSLISNKLRLFNCVLDEEYDLTDTINMYDYIFAWSRVWPLYYSQASKISHEIADANHIPLHDYYVNSCDVFAGEIRFDSVSKSSRFHYIANPNFKKINLIQHNRLVTKYYNMDKSRKLRNYEMSFNHNV